eukprot:TRINITY_DN39377_c0_g1_i1.p1 TRINITY_DN39377_c0_g1~~TRINITY_DN39377_c0_g1_i1.p1  ORF type:complete len:680 (+),score=110.47 TRINITY_DN39377_c0_g1_i1:226-2040(+)
MASSVDPKLNREESVTDSLPTDSLPDAPSDLQRSVSDASCSSAGDDSYVGDMAGIGFSSILKLQRVSRKFKMKVRNADKPSHADIDRRLFIPNVYDFYDTEAREVRVRKMDGTVVHIRQKQKHRSSVVDEESDARSEVSDVDASDDMRTTFESNDSGSTPEPVPRPRKANNAEALANWGAIIGKVLHRKVLDFSTVKEKALRKRYGTDASDRRFEKAAGKQGGSRLALGRCKAVVQQAFALIKKEARRKKDITDAEWEDPALLTHLFSTEYVDTLMMTASAAAKIVGSQPPMISIPSSAPCRVFGDLHGQMRDLLMFFHAFGRPAQPDQPATTFIFNGDFVDRGSHQVETIGLLLALKVAYPTQIYLLRGNHEDSTMNERYGFSEECERLLGAEIGKKIYDLIQKVFNLLPLACLVGDRALIMHGGIGDGTWRLGDLFTVPRPLTPEDLLKQKNRWLYNILWSDPIEDGESADPNTSFGVHPSPRGEKAMKFSWNVTKTFCARNGIALIIRSHESKQDSRGFEVMHSNMLLRVFSARDYEDHDNDSAVLLLKEESVFVDDDGDETVDLLTVRPQVLRSTAKQRVESQRRAAASKPGKTGGKKSN